jgi:hypothetical protein
MPENRGAALNGQQEGAMADVGIPGSDQLAVPYVIAIESVVGEDGMFRRRAWHPELPGCEVSAYSAHEAIEQLEVKRQEYIAWAVRRGEPVRPPRPPLRGVPAAGPGPVEAAAAWRHREERRVGQ